MSRDGNYLNDLVLDVEAGFAYITDSGDGPTGFFGGIVGRSSTYCQLLKSHQKNVHIESFDFVVPKAQNTSVDEVFECRF